MIDKGRFLRVVLPRILIILVLMGSGFGLVYEILTTSVPITIEMLLKGYLIGLLISAFAILLPGVLIQIAEKDNKKFIKLFVVFLLSPIFSWGFIASIVAFPWLVEIYLVFVIAAIILASIGDLKNLWILIKKRGN